jgi:hypothetical protein
VLATALPIVRPFSGCFGEVAWSQTRDFGNTASFLLLKPGPR